MEKFCDLFTSDLITTLTYVLMDNFCPCFVIIQTCLCFTYDKFSVDENINGVPKMQNNFVKMFFFFSILR